MRQLEIELTDGITYVNDPQFENETDFIPENSVYHFYYRPAQIRKLKHGKYAIKNLLWGNDSGIYIVYPSGIKRIYYY